jgi:hypothetical protein
MRFNGIDINAFESSYTQYHLEKKVKKIREIFIDYFERHLGALFRPRDEVVVNYTNYWMPYANVRASIGPHCFVKKGICLISGVCWLVLDVRYVDTRPVAVFFVDGEIVEMPSDDQLEHWHHVMERIA